MEIPLLHHTGPMLIYPRWRLPYYTTPAKLPQMIDYPTTPSLLNVPQMDITLLHLHPMLIYLRWRLLYYITPANITQIEIILLECPC